MPDNKNWIRAKIWEWLTLSEKIVEIQERAARHADRIKSLEDSSTKAVINNARLKDEVKEYNKIVNEQGKSIVNLNDSLDNRRQEIDSLIERFQNFDNEEVIRDLHLRIEELENKKRRKEPPVLKR